MKVRDDDSVYVLQTSLYEYAVIQFKEQGTNADYKITISCKARSNMATSIYPVRLQVFNRNSSQWVTLDTENEAGANTVFTLNGVVDYNVQYYYDVGNWVSVRIYQ